MSSFFLLSLFSAQAQTTDNPWGVQQPTPPPVQAPPVVAPPPASADPLPPPGSCSALYQADATLNPWGTLLEESESCAKLAAGVWGQVQRFQGELPLDAVEPVHRAPVGVTGTAAQIQAAPAIQPVPLTGGSLSFVQQEAGARVLGGISINPAALRAETASEYAAAARGSDLSVYLPIDLLDESLSLDNIGIRWRQTLRSDESATAAIDLARPAYDQLNVPEGVLIGQVTTLLSQAVNKPACLSALKTGEATTIEEGCGASLPALKPYMMVDRGDLATLQSERGDLDATQLGLELGLDIGDPTFSGAPGRQGEHLSAEVGIGRMRGDFRLRARGGLRYSHLTEADLHTVWLIAAAGGDYLLSNNIDPSVVSMGLSGKVAGAPTGALPSNTINLDVGVMVPMRSQARFGLGLSLPIYGQETQPVLAITGDWLNLAPGG